MDIYKIKKKEVIVHVYVKLLKDVNIIGDKDRPRSAVASALSNQGLFNSLNEVCVRLYSRTSMARIPLGPWKIVRAMGSLSQ